MKTLKSIVIELILPFLLCWFFMSLLIDVVAVPTVFKNISNLEEGGRIGMTIFHRFNCFEIFFGLSILSGICLKEKTYWPLVALSIVLLGMSLLYTFFMTPTIAKVAQEFHRANINSSEYGLLRREHAMYHNLYRYLDTLKLSLLLFFSSVMIYLNIKHKERV